MRPLPCEIVHIPFSSGQYRLAMNLIAVPETDWFELDDRYLSEQAEKRRLLTSARDDVFAARPQSAEARREAFQLILAALTTCHPDWFSHSRNHLTGEPIDPTALDPLDLAGRLVQEDLCLIQDGILTAATLCFPSRWRLADKIGKPLAAVHGPVPLYEGRLSGAVDRFMLHLKPGHIATRLNWSLLDDPALFQPEVRTTGIPRATSTNVGTGIFLRVERQTLRRLPTTAAILFGIRVHVYPLMKIIDRPHRAAELAAAIRALPESISRYKGLYSFRDALLGWLETLTE